MSTRRVLARREDKARQRQLEIEGGKVIRHVTNGGLSDLTNGKKPPQRTIDRLWSPTYIWGGTPQPPSMQENVGKLRRI